MDNTEETATGDPFSRPVLMNVHSGGKASISPTEYFEIMSALEIGYEQYVILGLEGEADVVFKASRALAQSEPSEKSVDRMWVFNGPLIVIGALYERMNSLVFVFQKTKEYYGQWYYYRDKINVLQSVLIKLGENGFEQDVQS